MKKRIKNRVVLFFLIVSVVLVVFEAFFSLLPAFSEDLAADQKIKWMLDEKIFQIFEKYPMRFTGNPAEDFDEEEGGNKPEIYFLITDSRLFPGVYVELLDGSIAYWTRPGDNFLEIFQDIRKIRGQSGQVSRAELLNEAKKQGLKSPDKIAIDDILVFKWREAK